MDRRIELFGRPGDAHQHPQCGHCPRRRRGLDSWSTPERSRHHFVYLYPPFFQVYADLAHRFRLPVRVPFPIETNFAPDLVKSMIVSNSALLKSRRLAHPDHFIGTFFGRRALVLGFLLHLLDTLPDGVSELMCHPGYEDPDSDSGYRSEREIELALLTNPMVKERIKTLDIELITFGALDGDLEPEW